MESFAGLFVSSQWEVERRVLDGRPSCAYLGRSYGITLQRQIDISLTKQTTHVLHATGPPPPHSVLVHARARAHTGVQILRVEFAYTGLKEVIPACV